MLVTAALLTILLIGQTRGVYNGFHRCAYYHVISASLFHLKPCLITTLLTLLREGFVITGQCPMLHIVPVPKHRGNTQLVTPINLSLLPTISLAFEESPPNN